MLGPPKSEHVLEGIRYELIRELCEEVGIAYNLRPIAEADVLSADELLLSSATKEVLPVTTLDGEPVGHGALRGKPGPGLREALRGLPARQADPVDLSEGRRARSCRCREPFEIAPSLNSGGMDSPCKTFRPSNR